MSTRPFEVRPGLTAWLGLTLIVGALSSAALWSVGGRGLGLHLLVSAPMLYFAFICIHDGVHGVLARSAAVNDGLGWLLATAVALPFPLLRSAHLRHHALVGSVHDPEHIVYGASLPRLLIRLPLVPLYYLREVRHLGRAGRLALALHGLIWVTIVALGGATVALGWLLPVAVAVVWFGFTTVYVPHCADRRRLMRYFNFHSGYHDDHHRDRGYPFHQYFQLRLDGLRHHGMRPTHRYEMAWLEFGTRHLRWPPGRR